MDCHEMDMIIKVIFQGPKCPILVFYYFLTIFSKTV